MSPRVPPSEDSLAPGTRRGASGRDGEVSGSFLRLPDLGFLQLKILWPFLKNFSQNITAEQRFRHRPQNQVTATCSRPVSSRNSLQGCMTDWWTLDDMPAPFYPRKAGIIIEKQSKRGVCSEHAVGQLQRTGVLGSCHVRTYYALDLVSRPLLCVVGCFPPFLLKPGDTCRYCRRHVQVL